MNTSHPLFGKKQSDVTDNDLESLSDEEHREYMVWSIQQTLNYMVNEGFIESFICPESGEVLYRNIDKQE
jgi:hypothetical protein